MSLIIGNVLPMRDRMYAKAVLDGRDPDQGIYGRVMEGILRLPHGSVVLMTNIYAGSGSGTSVNYIVRCDGDADGFGMIWTVAKDSEDVPEDVQESGVFPVRLGNDGLRAVAFDPEAEDLDEVVDEIEAVLEEEGTIAGLPPLSMIEVHGPVESSGARYAPGGSGSGSGGGAAPGEAVLTMHRAMILLGEDGEVVYTEMTPVTAEGDDGGEDDGGEDDEGGGDDPDPKKAGSPGDVLKGILARIRAGKDLEDAGRRAGRSRRRSAAALDAARYQVGDDVREDRAGEPAEGPSEQGEEGLRRNPSFSASSHMVFRRSMSLLASLAMRFLSSSASAILSRASAILARIAPSPPS